MLMCFVVTLFTSWWIVSTDNRTAVLPEDSAEADHPVTKPPTFLSPIRNEHNLYSTRHEVIHLLICIHSHWHSTDRFCARVMSDWICHLLSCIAEHIAQHSHIFVEYAHPTGSSGAISRPVSCSRVLITASVGAGDQTCNLSITGGPLYLLSHATPPWRVRPLHVCVSHYSCTLLQPKTIEFIMACQSKHCSRMVRPQGGSLILYHPAKHWFTGESKVRNNEGGGGDIIRRKVST